MHLQCIQAILEAEVRKMAEFCLECWNKMNNTNYPAKKFILTEENDLCEGCGELKKVVIMEKRHYYLHKFRLFFIPFKMVYWILYFLWRLIILPYTIYQYKKYEKLMAKRISDNRKNEPPKG